MDDDDVPPNILTPIANGSAFGQAPPGGILGAIINGGYQPVAATGSDTAAPPQPVPSPVGQYALPGVGLTYLDPQFFERTNKFMRLAQDQGIPLQFTSGYRTQDGQDDLHNDPNAITPAKYSLHSAGLAFDIDPKLTQNPATLSQLLSNAKQAGLNWGGNFSTPDTGHFYYDPGGNRQQLINNFSAGIQAFQNGNSGGP